MAVAAAAALLHKELDDPDKEKGQPEILLEQGLNQIETKKSYPRQQTKLVSRNRQKKGKEKTAYRRKIASPFGMHSDAMVESRLWSSSKKERKIAGWNFSPGKFRGRFFFASVGGFSDYGPLAAVGAANLRWVSIPIWICFRNETWRLNPAGSEDMHGGASRFFLGNEQIKSGYLILRFSNRAQATCGGGGACWLADVG